MDFTLESPDVSDALSWALFGKVGAKRERQHETEVGQTNTHFPYSQLEILSQPQRQLYAQTTSAQRAIVNNSSKHFGQLKRRLSSYLLQNILCLV